MHRELEILCDAVKQAGERVLHLAKEGFETYRKKDRSPVTSADLEANRILQEALMGHFPEDGWLSEESPDNSERLGKKRVWVVDPIDGTKHFMKGIPQYAISVALVENERLIVEAVQSAGITNAIAAMGRPTCAVLPEALQSDRVTISLGCIGNRVYTGLGDDEAYMAIPGSKLQDVVDKLHTIVEANKQLEAFHRSRAGAKA